MSLIVFKDVRDKDVAILGTYVNSVEYVSDEVSVISYRTGDQVRTINVKHPVLEIVAAVNKVVSWV